MTVTTIKTAINACLTCTFVGNITFCISCLTCSKYVVNFSIFVITFNYGRPRGTRTPGTWFWRPVLYQLSYWPSGKRMKAGLELHLFMDSVLFAPLAVLLERKFLCRVFLVLGCVIVATCALFTTEMDRFSHRFSNSNACRSRRCGVITR